MTLAASLLALTACGGQPVRCDGKPLRMLDGGLGVTDVPFATVELPVNAGMSFHGDWLDGAV